MAKEIVIEKKAYEDFELGSDPEIRFEGLKARPHIPFEGKFGTDGPDSQIGELRPAQQYTPEALVSEIERCMRDGYKKHPIIQKRRWLGGSFPDNKPLGGHIHFGSSGSENIELKIGALDKLLAPVVLMIEDKDASLSRRTGSNYGKLGFHGGKLDARYRGFKTAELYNNESHPLSHKGYEYRPLPSWVVSKQLTSGILSLAKVIGFQTHNTTLHRHINKQLSFINLDKKFCDKYVECDKRFFAGVIPTIHRIVKSFKLYPMYDKNINYLFHLISQGRNWNENTDLKSRWNIIPNIIQTKKVTQKIWTFADAWNNVLTTDPNKLIGIASDQETEAESENGFLIGGM